MDIKPRWKGDGVLSRKSFALAMILLSVCLLAGCAPVPGPEARMTPQAVLITGYATVGAEPKKTPIPESMRAALPEEGQYTARDDVARYLFLYRRLPDNFITKPQARALGWSGGDLRPYAPGKAIGGDRFGNYEGLLPEKKGRVYYECDVDTLNKPSRGAKRIVYSSDGLIYYTDDHYKHFTLLYSEDGHVGD